MPGEHTSCNSQRGYGVQIAVSVFLLLLGILLFIIFIIPYQNRLQYKLPVEYWLWIFLGFGLFFILVGLIWLIIVLYASSSQRRACCEMHEKQQYRSEMNEPMMGSSGMTSAGQRSGAYFVTEGTKMPQ